MLKNEALCSSPGTQRQQHSSLYEPGLLARTNTQYPFCTLRSTSAAKTSFAAAACSLGRRAPQRGQLITQAVFSSLRSQDWIKLCGTAPFTYGRLLSSPETFRFPTCYRGVMLNPAALAAFREPGRTVPPGSLRTAPWVGTTSSSAGSKGASPSLRSGRPPRADLR